MNRVFAGVMAVVMLVVVLVSAVFIVSHADHDCTGEDCPVCACIQQCERILNGAEGGFLLTATGILPVVLSACSIAVFYCAITFGTPVSAKVRMNN